jgi:hypothetical protein
MNKVRHRLLFLAVIALAAALLGACGKEEPKEDFVELEDQLGFSTSGIMERQSRAEGIIRDCMQEQGFEYVPVDPFAQRAALTGKARMSDEEFLKQFGYGISTLFGRGSSTSDPNERYRRSLPPADRAAYDRALFGEGVGITFAEAVESGDFSELGGCTKKATEAVFGGAGVLARLVGKLDELDERIVQDQRMIKAVEKWSSCMADKGFRYEEPDEIDTDLAQRFKAIMGPGVPTGASPPPPKGLTYDKAALQALQREEVKIGTADYDCEREHITPVEAVVRPQYEQDFRKQNRQLLVQVRPVGR